MIAISSKCAKNTCKYTMNKKNSYYFIKVCFWRNYVIPQRPRMMNLFFFIRYVSQDMYVIVQTQNEMVDGLMNTCTDDIINMNICH